MDLKTVKKVATLARLEMDEKDLEAVQAKVSNIMKFVEQLGEVNTDKVEPLANVVADLNHQYVQQIGVSDPELGRTPITGVIVLDDQAAVLARLSLMLPVRSIPSERGTLLLRK